MKRYVVRTRDVDGSTSQYFATPERARKRFESMLGYTMEQAYAEFFSPYKLPTAEQMAALKFLRGVSSYGTAVTWFDRGEAAA